MTSVIRPAEIPTARPRVPDTYQIPPFPSLYWPFRVPRETQPTHYLYNIPEIWRFTLLWTLSVYAVVYIFAALWAVSIQVLRGTRRRWDSRTSGRSERRSAVRNNTSPKTEETHDNSTLRHAAPRKPIVRPKSKRRWLIWLVPFVYALIAGIEAVISGTIVGLMLGAIYQAGFFKMSTWIPFIWALISALVLIISSFSMQGGL